MTAILKIHPEDNVAVAVTDLRKGDAADGIALKSDIPRGHKVALKAFEAGDVVVKYGMPIGSAACRISAGEHVHSHNVASRLTAGTTFEFAPAGKSIRSRNGNEKTFQGFRRKNGSIGIRNDLWIIPTVGCVNRLARRLAERVDPLLPREQARQILALEHPLGCSQSGEDHERTARMLAALASHPNAGGVLILSLGCENNTMESFRRRLEPDEKRFRFLKAQEERDEFEAGISLLRELSDEAAEAKRETVPISELKIGMKCGGSDGLSGVTANPLLGVISDRIVAAGGSSVLTEVPEMFGAESILLNRCIDRGVFEKGVRMVDDFKAFFLRYGERIDDNPSPGNKEGGLSTLEDKSLGCIQKGGFAPVVDVLDYGRRVEKSGLNLLNGPGNDMVACTVLAAAGCQLILFTTGRGTPFGSIVPTLKVSSNSELADSKPHWIDFDAGRLLRGTPLPELADQLENMILETASGTRTTLNEKNHFQEIALFKDGVTL